ncbi:hypothetical protein F3N43_03705 [Alkalilimnicola sp. S0819]|nr:hypothetical protein F3N43_03705 [Alkalilimnicola sp. S0819]MPQ15733.1 hypothetical protein [Alkalilimnicola sp. S0819]
MTRDFGIGTGSFKRWRREMDVAVASDFPGLGNPRDQELARLKQELARVKQERDYGDYQRVAAPLSLCLQLPLTTGPLYRGASGSQKEATRPYDAPHSMWWQDKPHHVWIRGQQKKPERLLRPHVRMESRSQCFLGTLASTSFATRAGAESGTNNGG